MSDPGKDQAGGHPEKPARFVDMRIRPDAVFEIYEAASAADARSFLEMKTVSQDYLHIIVDTPEGKWGRDIQGIFLEELLPMQYKLDTAQCEGLIADIPSAFGFGLAARHMTDNYLAVISCGNCAHLWCGGIRYRNRTIVKCPGCGSFNLVDSTKLICFTQSRTSRL
jgi:hypothetical protein